MTHWNTVEDYLAAEEIKLPMAHPDGYGRVDYTMICAGCDEPTEDMRGEVVTYGECLEIRAGGRKPIEPLRRMVRHLKRRSRKQYLDRKQLFLETSIATATILIALTLIALGVLIGKSVACDTPPCKLGYKRYRTRYKCAICILPSRTQSGINRRKPAENPSRRCFVKFPSTAPLTLKPLNV